MESQDGPNYVVCQRIGDEILKWDGDAQVAVKAFELAAKILDKAKTSSPAFILGQIKRKLAIAKLLAGDKNETGLELYPDLLAIVKLRKDEPDPAGALTAAKKATVETGTLPWGWIVRYLAAKKLQNDGEAKTAYEGWMRLRSPNDLRQLHRLLPEPFEKYLKRPRPGELKTGRQQDTGLTIGGSPVVKNAERHDLKIVGEKRYVIDLESSAFDAYLILLDSDKKVVLWDDDSGGGLNARLRIANLPAGDYTIIATALPPNGVGPYTLLIREAPAEDTLPVRSAK
jgi:hypothetical protein